MAIVEGDQEAEISARNEEKSEFDSQYQAENISSGDGSTQNHEDELEFKEMEFLEEEEVELVGISRCPFRDDSFTKGSLLNYPALWKWKLSTMVSASSVGAFILAHGAASRTAQQLASKTTIVPTLLSAAASNLVSTVSENPGIGSFILSSSLTAAALFSGTFLQAAAANSMNQVFEVELDSQMSRTRNRPLVRQHLTTSEAVIQALAVGSLGTYILYKFTTPTTALLGMTNIFLYTCVYTPLKTRHWLNTWVGTLNGALPILMGATCIEKLSSLSPTTLLACIALYSWQIPHFMAISFKCKADYERAGFQMLPSVDPHAAAFQALLHSALLFPASIWAYYSGGLSLTALTITFPLNYFLLLKPSYSFYLNPSAESSHILFLDSLYHLPSFFLLLSVSPLLSLSSSSSPSFDGSSLLSSLSSSLKDTFTSLSRSLKSLGSSSSSSSSSSVVSSVSSITNAKLTEAIGTLQSKHI